jgi:ferredoxin
VKLTNTLEVVNAGNLPAGEKMLYLSGRALHPVSIALAAKLREQFGDGLDISFCAGVDAFNAGAVLGAGLSPVTVCTDLLKPGGYGRLRQCVEAMRSAPWLDISEYARQAADDPRYRKDAHPYPSIKGERELTPFDCAGAPCMETCGAGQDIPGYLRLAAQGRFEDSLAVIQATNPFPNLLGAFCDRLCQPRCNRIHLDRPVRIREVKRVAAQAGATDPGAVYVDPASEGVRVAVRGSGLAGLSCAYFLTQGGTGADVYGPCPKSQAKLLDSPAGKRDVAAILAAGVRLLDGEAPADALECTGTSGSSGLNSGAATEPGVLAAAVGRGRAVALAYLKAHESVEPQAGKGAPAPGSPLSFHALQAQHAEFEDSPDFQDLAREKATRRNGPQQVDTPVDASREAARCLRCDQVCSICVTVCPNRANIAVRRQDSWPLSYPVQRAVRRGDAVAVETLGSVPVAQRVQVVNVADFCNECGNCAVFCPTSGAPYRHKPRLHLSRESFEAAGEGAWFREPWSMEAMIQGSAMSVTSTFFGGRAVLKVKTPVFTALLDAKSLEAASVALATGVAQAELALAAQAAMLYALALTIHPILSEPSC